MQFTHLISDVWRKFIKFGLVGVINTGVDFSIYLFLTRIALWHFLAAHITAFTLATINSFFLNKFWTFKDHTGKIRRQYPLFLALQTIGLLVSSGIINFTITELGFHDILAKVVATLIVMIWNFFLSKNLVFTTRAQ